MSLSKLKKINEFTTNRKILDNSHYNLLSLGGPQFKPGKFRIKSSDDFIKFIKIYNDIINNNINPHYLEPTFNPKNLYNFDNSFNDHNVIKIDLDFQYEYSKELEETNKDELLKHKYNSKQIGELINIYLEYLNKYVKLNSKINFTNEYDKINESLRIFLLERDSAYINVRKESKKVKDGIHIIIPTFAFPIPILHKVRLDVLADERFIKIIEDIGQLNKIEDVLDESVISKNPWFLYKSGKPFSAPYLISKMYKLKRDKVNKLYKAYSLKNDDFRKYIKDDSKIIFELSNFGIKQIVPVLDEDKFKQISEDLNDRCNTGNYTNKSTMDYNKIMGINTYLNFKNNNVKKPESETITLQILEDLLNCLNDERSRNYNDWWQIGQTLYNIDWQKGLMAFINFSKRCSDKFDIKDIKEYWRRFEQNYMNQKYQYNIKFLKDMAFKDNKSKYKKISELMIIEILTKIIDIFRQPIYAKKIGDSTISKEIKKIIDADSLMNFVSIENKQWYYYKNHKWILDQEGNQIKMYLKNNILSIFKKYYSNCCETNKNIQNDLNNIKSREANQIENTTNNMDDFLNSDLGNFNNEVTTLESERKNINQLMLNQSIMEERIKTALRLVTYLEDSAKRANLVKELSSEFYDATFYKNLDSNPNIFHCLNGVFDLDTCEFRDGSPNDMVTISSNNIYIKDEIRFSDPEYQKYDEELNDFLDKILPDNELKEYMMNYWAISLSGKSIKQTCNVCTGTGSNGKTVNFELLEIVFGEYFSTASPALLTKGRNDANAPSPAVANLRGKRLVCCSEPDEKEPIKTGIMKEMTGGDRLVGRHLNMPPIEFRPQHNIFFLCNDKPDIESTDEGTWRRIRVTPYMSKFCDLEDEKLKNKKFKYHFPKDASIKEKFEMWKEVLLNDLIKRYIELKQNDFDLPLPKLVKEAIDEYKSDHNIYETFKKDCLIKSSGERLQSGDAFDAFKEHAEQCNQKIRNINRNTFITEMGRVLGKLKSNKFWKDWKIIENYGDDEDNENEQEESDSDSE